MNAALGKSTNPDPLDFVEFIDRSDEGLCVLTLNSEVYTDLQSDGDRERGRLGTEQLNKIRVELENNEEALKNSFRVAMIHKHPVLIPELAESNRGVDSVLESGKLLNLLQKYNFHLVLHGHKHWPTSFTVDHNNAYHNREHRMPILVASAGTLGSEGFRPGAGHGVNCYNRIFATYNAATEEARIVV